MRLFGFEIKRANQTLSPALSSGGGWFNSLFPSVIREANPGDWQRNITYSAECLLSNPIVFACITLVAGDVGKLRPMLMRYDERKDIYTEARSTAFSPVIEKPNPYQTRIDFFTQWVMSLPYLRQYLRAQSPR
jgi:phage portal protein BeeE